MKKLQKLSLNAMKNEMSRNEMRVIKAGSAGEPGTCNCNSQYCYMNGMRAVCGGGWPAKCC
ncbi:MULTISPECIES: TIGR04149 family rSAM-modified RiPP [unclassified Chryseobacterium]|uniref:TIGR04149 family rSAM-modified RiPP n=1 Tax=unclassified Chryseobacterium TaxID=2593645 RepID=UPI00054ED327|nr:TIGR04149 family rSAM-modified RiPP [Chryseobacterium sp. S0630]MCP1301400.1 TIGR04149 family rSAM-modified RiPP [Chryseobacterium sp. S0630]